MTGNVWVVADTWEGAVSDVTYEVQVNDDLLDDWASQDYGPELAPLKSQVEEATALFHRSTDHLKECDRDLIDYYASDLTDMGIYTVNSWLMLCDARGSDRKRAMAGNGLEALLLEPLQAERVGGTPTGIQTVQLSTLGIPHDGKQVAANPAAGRLHQPQRGVCSNGGIHSRAARLENVQGDLGRERLARGDHGALLGARSVLGVTAGVEQAVTRGLDLTGLVYHTEMDRTK